MEGYQGNRRQDGTETFTTNNPTGTEPGNGPSAFGRGWIPVERDIGLPDDDDAPAAFAAGGASPHSPDHHAAADDPLAYGRDYPRFGDEYPGPGWTPQRKVRFLDALSEHGDVRAACRRATISTQSAYRLRRRDGVFAEAWDAAVLLARPAIEQALGARALEGTLDPVFYRGKQVGYRRRYDNRLLLAHLGRLDRLAEARPAGLRAGRFDELLALVAGERFAEDMADCDVGASYGRPRHAADPLLPMPRERYVAMVGEEAGDDEWYEALEPVMDAAVEAGLAEEDWRGDLSPDRVLEPEQIAALDDVRAEGVAQGRAEAAEVWDDWQARAHAVVAQLDAEEEAREELYRDMALGIEVVNYEDVYAVPTPAAAPDGHAPRAAVARGSAPGAAGGGWDTDGWDPEAWEAEGWELGRPIEIKSLSGVPGAGAGAGAGAGSAGGTAPLDRVTRVTRVNLSRREREILRADVLEHALGK